MLPSSIKISVLPDSPLRSQLMSFFKLVEKMHGREKRCEQGEHWNWQQYKILWKGTFLYVSNESCYRGVRRGAVVHVDAATQHLFFLLRCAGQIERRTSYYVQALISDFCVLLKQAYLCTRDLPGVALVITYFTTTCIEAVSFTLRVS